MARRRSTRGRPRAHPRGLLVVRGGGYGFVQTAEGEFFIPEAKMSGAFDGDLVEIAPLPVRGSASKQRHQAPSSEKPAARVVRVIDRAHDTIVGRYEVAEPFGVVVPEDTRIPYDIFTMRSSNPDIEDGSLVRVRITTFPSHHSAATGVVEEVLGHSDEESASIDLVVARHKLETVFSEAALEEARGARVGEDRALSQGYRDLTTRFIFTVDPDDARDFDDAVSFDAVDCKDNSLSDLNLSIVDTRGIQAIRWRLGVHIADVSYYVPWGSSVDFDARRRATSVYLADRVVPMLPEALSCDVCSLRPGEARRTMTLDLYLDDQARLVAYDAYLALICSNMRLTYAQAQELLEANKVSTKSFEEVTRKLHGLARVAQKRVAMRAAAGGLDFDTVEARVRLDAEGYPIDIEKREKTQATSLIEEAMIFANETVAEHLLAAEFPCIYRVHERPSPDSLAALVSLLQEFSWFSQVDTNRFVAGNCHELQKVLTLSANRLEGDLVSSLLLRSMKRAVYRPNCEGHYGLASKAYAHFTSPIRRYPDLVVHRMLRAQLTRRPEKFDQEVSALSWLSEHSLDMERVADTAARESQEIKMIEYLTQFIGQEFSAVVSGVANWGVYVRLDNTAEGLIPIKNLGAEYFALDEARYSLVGQDTGVVYRLGQRLNVVLTVADYRSRRLDFRPVHKKERR